MIKTDNMTLIENLNQGYKILSKDDIKDKFENFCYFAIFFGCIIVLLLLK